LDMTLLAFLPCLENPSPAMQVSGAAPTPHLGVARRYQLCQSDTVPLTRARAIRVFTSYFLRSHQEKYYSLPWESKALKMIWARQSGDCPFQENPHIVHIEREWFQLDWREMKYDQRKVLRLYSSGLWI
jgi:hypothetical protein